MRKLLALALLAAACIVPAAAQPVSAEQPDREIDEAVRAHVIEGALAALQRARASSRRRSPHTSRR